MSEGGSTPDRSARRELVDTRPRQAAAGECGSEFAPWLQELRRFPPVELQHGRRPPRPPPVRMLETLHYGVTGGLFRLMIVLGLSTRV